MNNLPIEPTIKNGGSAFVDNSINNTRPLSSLPGKEKTNVVKLSDWCKNNFISTDTGYTLLKKKLLVGFRRHRVWWVCANQTCLNELLDYLGIEQLAFDPENE